MKATWKNITLAESDHTIDVAGVHYFPQESIKEQYFRESQTHTTCPLKGRASYYDVVVDGEIKTDAAWFYPDPLPAFREIKDHVAFYGPQQGGVEVLS